MATINSLQVIDGSVLEGGGQILRNAIALSALLQKPIQIKNIRHGRPQPGLKNQHRTGLELVAQIASAELTGASNGSTQVQFVPGQIELPGTWTADTVTAGSTTLLMQIAFPLLLFKTPSSTMNESGPSVLSLLGGTNAIQAPQADYTQHIFLPFFRKHFLPLRTSSSDEQGGGGGLPSVEFNIKKRGYFPKGGGELEVRVQSLLPGEKLRPVKLGGERGRLVSIRGIAHYAGLPSVIGDGMREGVVKMIKKQVRKAWFPGAEVRVIMGEGKREDENKIVETQSGTQEVVVDIRVKREPKDLTKGAGSGIVIWAEFENGSMLGGSAVGKKGLEATEVGGAAVEELGKALEAGGCVDNWIQDQMIIFMALAEGKSEVRCGVDELTLHTRTAIWIAEQLTKAKFEVNQEENGQWFIRCNGIGFSTML